MADIKNIKNLKIDGVTYNIIDDEAARQSAVDQLTDQVNELLAPVLTIDSNTPSREFGGALIYDQEVATEQLLKNYNNGFRVCITYSIDSDTYKKTLIGTVRLRNTGLNSQAYMILAGNSESSPNYWTIWPKPETPDGVVNEANSIALQIILASDTTYAPPWLGTVQLIAKGDYASESIPTFKLWSIKGVAANESDLAEANTKINNNKEAIDILNSTDTEEGSVAKTVKDAIAAIPTPDVSGQIAAHNESTEAHADIRTAIPTKLSQLFNDSGFIDFSNIDEWDTARGDSQVTEVSADGITYTNQAEFRDGMGGMSYGRGYYNAQLPIVAGEGISIIKNSNGKAEISADGLATKSELSAVATSGSYNDLTNKPAIPTFEYNESTYELTIN